MTEYPLHLREGHLYVEVDGAMWLLDTGAPQSFGRSGVAIAGRPFEVGAASAGLGAAGLSDLVKVDCAGLFGSDVLSHLDWILDLRAGVARVSSGQLEHQGTSIPLEGFMGIPIVEARVGTGRCRLFFDTGAQISYLEQNLLGTGTRTGRMTDFHPSIGEFETDVYEVEIGLGGTAWRIRCGSLPGPLQGLLGMAGVAGILGNEVMRDRVTGYFPRRSMLLLEHRT